MSPKIVVRRMLYRTAVVLLRAYWLIARPSVTGIKCALTHGDELLMVRHTYGSRAWDLPGGSPKRHEPPEQTARRETAEEVGLQLTEWKWLGAVTGDHQGRHDTIRCFAAEVKDTELTLDLGEIQEARWFPLDDLPHDMGRYVPKIVALVHASRQDRDQKV